MKTIIKKIKSSDKCVNVLASPNTSVNGVYIELRFKAGCLNDPVGKLGTAHFLEHSLNNFPTKSHSATERMIIRRDFNYYNAFTSREYLGLNALVYKDDFEKVLDFMTDSISNLIYDKNEFEKQRKIIASEISTQGNSSMKISYSRRYNYSLQDRQAKGQIGKIDGTLETLSKITLKDLEKYNHDYLTLDNMTLCVAGNFSMRKLTALVKQYVLPRINQSGKTGLLCDDLHEWQKSHLEYIPAQEQGAVVHLIAPIKPSPKHSTAKFENDSYFATRLLQKVASDFFREKKHLCYATYAEVASFAGMLSADVLIQCQEDKIKEVIDCIPEFYRLLENDLDEKSFASVHKVLSQFVNLNILDLLELTQTSFSVYEVLGLPYNNKYLKLREKLYKETTYPEMNNLLKEITKPNPFLVIVSNNNNWMKFDYKSFCNKLHEQPQKEKLPKRSQKQSTKMQNSTKK